MGQLNRENLREASSLCRFYTRNPIGAALVDAMGAVRPKSIVDLGCGAGALSSAAARRWSKAKLVTVDIDRNAKSSIEAALAKSALGRHEHFVLDALDVDLPSKILGNRNQFDASICNPPYSSAPWKRAYQRILDEAGLPVPRSQLKAATLTSAEERNANLISLESVGIAINALRVAAQRSRCVLLLDDAALTLTPEYLIEFFDVIRSLKSRTVAPKCSVYPGTTEYGPRFHARQEARVIPVWLPVEDPNYLPTMMAIGDKRFGVDGRKINEAARKQLAFAAFGMPRAYLSLLRDNATASGQQQQTLNKSIQQHRDGILAEYASLATKVPQFKTLVAKGRELFDAIIDVMRAANVNLVDERQLLIGIERSDFTPLRERMVKLLIEAGLLYEHPEVSHGGPDRTYRRFTPHIAALMAVRAFSGRSRGHSATAIVDFLNSRPVKHPIRRKLNTLLSEQSLAQIRIDLPACQKCGAKRVNEDQKFCHTFAPKASDLSMIANVMVNFVRTFNGLVFKAVLLNTVIHQYLSPTDTFSWKWGWTIHKDRSRFKRYYEAFAVQLDVPPSPSLSDVYSDFRDSEKKKIDAKVAKAAKDAAGT